MKTNEIEKVIESQYFPNDYTMKTDCGQHDTYQQLLQQKIINKLCEYCDGDIVEIGCHQGGTTTYLCDAVHPYNRNVIAIDPYFSTQSSNSSNCLAEGEHNYTTFLENTKNKTNLNLHRCSSFSQEGVETLENTNYFYVFIDGLHTYEGARQDLLNVIANTNFCVICFDDTNQPQVIQAINSVKQMYPDKLVRVKKPSDNIYKPKHKDFEFFIYNEDC